MVSKTPTVHLLHGFIGAGKTTYALKLAERTGGLRFSPDEWMATLHGTRPPRDLFTERYQRIDELIWTLAQQATAQGVDVILDFGFWTRKSRDSARRRVKEIGAQPQVHAVVCDIEVMRQRTKERSVRPDSRSLWIDEPAFNTFLLTFEPMQADEEFILVNNN